MLYGMKAILWVTVVVVETSKSYNCFLTEKENVRIRLSSIPLSVGY